MDKRSTVIKWYKRLGFPEKYDGRFEALLRRADLEIKNAFSDDAAENLLSALYQCEALEQKYREWGIDQGILYSTLSDIKHWTKTWYDLSGELGLRETGWLSNHLSGRLFRLGRLQFCPGQAMEDIPAHGIQKGDPVIEIHIPAGEPMGIDACKASIAEARRFFEKHFPEYRYRCFTCHSWLLDRTLEALLDGTSNILAFQKLFDIVSAEESDALLKYIFRWDAVREELRRYPAGSSLAGKVKDYGLSGGRFYVGYGVLDLARCERQFGEET